MFGLYLLLLKNCFLTRLSFVVVESFYRTAKDGYKSQIYRFESNLLYFVILVLTCINILILYRSIFFLTYFGNDMVCYSVADPTYMIRAVPSNASDNVYCTLLAHSAIHGAMAGYTGFTVGPVNSRHAYIPFQVRYYKILNFLVGMSM